MQTEQLNQLVVLVIARRGDPLTTFTRHSRLKRMSRQRVQTQLRNMMISLKVQGILQMPTLFQAPNSRDTTTTTLYKITPEMRKQQKEQYCAARTAMAQATGTRASMRQLMVQTMKQVRTGQMGGTAGTRDVDGVDDEVDKGEENPAAEGPVEGLEKGEFVLGNVDAAVHYVLMQEIQELDSPTNTHQGLISFSLLTQTPIHISLSLPSSFFALAVLPQIILSQLSSQSHQQHPQSILPLPVPAVSPITVPGTVLHQPHFPSLQQLPPQLQMGPELQLQSLVHNLFFDLCPVESDRVLTIPTFPEGLSGRGSFPDGFAVGVGVKLHGLKVVF